jgi:hypothetical protein
LQSGRERHGDDTEDRQREHDFPEDKPVGTIKISVGYNGCNSCSERLPGD